MGEIELLKSIDGRLGRIEVVVTELVGSAVTADECRERHKGASTLGFNIVSAVVAAAAVLVAWLK